MLLRKTQEILRLSLFFGLLGILVVPGSGKSLSQSQRQSMQGIFEDVQGLESRLSESIDSFQADNNGDHDTTLLFDDDDRLKTQKLTNQDQNTDRIPGHSGTLSESVSGGARHHRDRVSRKPGPCQTMTLEEMMSEAPPQASPPCPNTADTANSHANSPKTNQTDIPTPTNKTELVPGINDVLASQKAREAPEMNIPPKNKTKTVFVSNGGCPDSDEPQAEVLAAKLNIALDEWGDPRLESGTYQISINGMLLRTTGRKDDPYTSQYDVKIAKLTVDECGDSCRFDIFPVEPVPTFSLLETSSCRSGSDSSVYRVGKPEPKVLIQAQGPRGPIGYMSVPGITTDDDMESETFGGKIFVGKYEDCPKGECDFYVRPAAERGRYVISNGAWKGPEKAAVKDEELTEEEIKDANPNPNPNPNSNPNDDTKGDKGDEDKNDKDDDEEIADMMESAGLSDTEDKKEEAAEQEDVPVSERGGPLLVWRLHRNLRFHKATGEGMSLMAYRGTDNVCLSRDCDFGLKRLDIIKKATTKQCTELLKRKLPYFSDASSDETTFELWLYPEQVDGKYTIREDIAGQDRGETEGVCKYLEPISGVITSVINKEQKRGDSFPIADIAIKVQGGIAESVLYHSLDANDYKATRIGIRMRECCPDAISETLKNGRPLKMISLKDLRMCLQGPWEWKLSIDGGRLSMSVRGNNPQDLLFDQAKFVALEWSHLAVSYSTFTKQIKVYINGSLAQTETYRSAKGFKWREAELGGCQQTGIRAKEDCFYGYMKDLRIWREVRKEEDIKKDFEQEIVVPDQVISLVAAYPMNHHLGDLVNERNMTGYVTFSKPKWEAGYCTHRVKDVSKSGFISTWEHLRLNNQKEEEESNTTAGFRQISSSSLSPEEQAERQREAEVLGPPDGNCTKLSGPPGTFMLKAMSKDPFFAANDVELSLASAKIAVGMATNVVAYGMDPMDYSSGALFTRIKECCGPDTVSYRAKMFKKMLAVNVPNLRSCIVTAGQEEESREPTQYPTRYPTREPVPTYMPSNSPTSVAEFNSQNNFSGEKEPSRGEQNKPQPPDKKPQNSTEYTNPNNSLNTPKPLSRANSTGVPNQGGVPNRGGVPGGEEGVPSGDGCDAFNNIPIPPPECGKEEIDVYSGGEINPDPGMARFRSGRNSANYSRNSALESKISMKSSANVSTRGVPRIRPETARVPVQDKVFGKRGTQMSQKPSRADVQIVDDDHTDSVYNAKGGRYLKNTCEILRPLGVSLQQYIDTPDAAFMSVGQVAYKLERDIRTRVIESGLKTRDFSVEILPQLIKGCCHGGIEMREGANTKGFGRYLAVNLKVLRNCIEERLEGSTKTTIVTPMLDDLRKKPEDFN
ncbi:hypothetical protein AAMO2058_001063500 [Amorphochlora amoebiformis]